MDDSKSLSHSRWECKYHVVFIPKCGRKTLYGQLRPHLGEVFRKLAMCKESTEEEGHLMQDHVHMLSGADDSLTFMDLSPIFDYYARLSKGGVRPV
jgi:REP element-mobilizing transposase RayT